jgi:hypothetical protein
MHYTRENTRFVSSDLITLRTTRKHSWCMRLRVRMYVCMYRWRNSSRPSACVRSCIAYEILIRREFRIHFSSVGQFTLLLVTVSKY